MRVEVNSVEADDSGRFLPSVLEGVETERHEARGVLRTPYTKDAALLVQRVAVCLGKGQRCEHGLGDSVVDGRAYNRAVLTCRLRRIDLYVNVK